MKTEASKATNNTTGTENKTDNSKTKAPVQKAVDPAKEKADLKQQIKKEKPVYNLEATLELLSNLQTKTRQRGTLLATINKLEKFEIDIERDDDDEMGGGRYQGCSLRIEDDNHNKFSTGNPIVIDAVTQFIKEKCASRLTEIEATIVLP